MTNTNELKKLMAEELARIADGFSDEEIINGCAFEATVEFNGKTYKATTDHTDGELEVGASEEQIVELLDRLIDDAVENMEIVACVNTLHIEGQISRKQASAIARIIEEHNDRLFDGRDYIDPEFITGADFTCIDGEEDSPALVSTFHQIADVLTDAWIRQSEITAQEIIANFMANVDEDESKLDQLKSVLDALEDGAALAESGYGDENQEAIEEAHSIVMARIKEIESQIIVVDLDNFTANRYAPAEFIKEFAEEAPTRNGVEKVYQFDEDQMAIIDMRTGTIARKVENKDEANEVLLDWALMDVSDECDRSIDAFGSEEQAIDFLDQMIENFECEENFEAVEKCKAMKKALNEMQTSKLISINNGLNYLTAEEAIEDILANNLWDAVVEAMNNETREQVHAKFAPCTELEFLEHYLELTDEDLCIG